MVFCPVVGSVVDSRTPVVSELPSQPVEMHVHGFGASWLDVVVADPASSGVVCLDGSLGLLVAHFR